MAVWPAVHPGLLRGTSACNGRTLLAAMVDALVCCSIVGESPDLLTAMVDTSNAMSGGGGPSVSPPTSQILQPTSVAWQRVSVIVEVERYTIL